MYLNRERALDIMERNNLDALVAFTNENITYLTDYQPLGIGLSLAMAILPRSESIPPTLLVGHSAIGYLAKYPTWVENVRSYEEFYYNNLFELPAGARPNHLEIYDHVEALAVCLRDLGLDRARLGFDHLNLADQLKEKFLPDLNALNAWKHFVNIRMVKTPDEIEVLRLGCQINQEALQETTSTVYEGMPAEEFDRNFRVAVSKRAGTTFYGRDGYSAAGWFHPTLNKGDLITTAALTTYKRYNNDLARTFVLGPPTKRQVTLHNAVVAACESVDRLVKPGVHTHEIFKTAQETVAERDGRPDRLAVYVHGIGLDWVEQDHHQRQPGFVFEPNMVFCVFMVQSTPEDGGGVFIEEQIRVTEDGCEQMETMTRELVEVG